MGTQGLMSTPVQDAGHCPPTVHQTDGGKALTVDDRRLGTHKPERVATERLSASDAPAGASEISTTLTSASGKNHGVKSESV